MKTVTKDELADILKKHALWLIGNGMGVRADLREANLCGANLSGANLSGADLSEANLSGANLSGANLSGAELYRANLREANLCGADLCGADLRGADLRGADLYRADLYRADLCGANLCGANLRGANLYRADLYRANLCEADLCGAKNLNFPIACPEKGTFTAFKKSGEYIIELEIPDDALRSSSTTRKCRCSKAKVVSITNLDGTASDIKSVCSGYDSNFFYTIGETVEVDNFDKDRWYECAPGIHFFITRQEAVDYNR